MAIPGFLQPILDHPVLFNFIVDILNGGQIKSITKVLSRIPHERVVDIACGTGGVSPAVQKDYLGFDISESYISYANRRYGGPNKKFIVMDANHIVLPRKSFDLAMIVNAIHHFSDEQVVQMLKQACELSRKYVLVIDVIPKNNIISKFFISLDRGEHFRPMERQKELFLKSNVQLLWDDFYESTTKIYRRSVLLGEVSASSS